MWLTTGHLMKCPLRDWKRMQATFCILLQNNKKKFITVRGLQELRKAHHLKKGDIITIGGKHSNAVILKASKSNERRRG